MASLNNADETDLDLPPPDAEHQIKKRADRAAKLIAGLTDQWPAADAPGVWETPRPALVQSSKDPEPRVAI